MPPCHHILSRASPLQIPSDSLRPSNFYDYTALRSFSSRNSRSVAFSGLSTIIILFPESCMGRIDSKTNCAALRDPGLQGLRGEQRVRHSTSIACPGRARKKNRLQALLQKQYIITSPRHIHQQTKENLHDEIPPIIRASINSSASGLGRDYEACASE